MPFIDKGSFVDFEVPAEKVTGQLTLAQLVDAVCSETEAQRSSTLVVAANDSSAYGKALADYVCTGADDHLKIQEAIDALPATGGEVKLLDGTYYIEASLVLDSYQTLRGCGRNTILTTTTDHTDIITATGGAGSEKTGILIADLCIEDRTNNVDYGIEFTYVDHSKIVNIWVNAAWYFGGVGLINSDYNEIIDITFYGMNTIDIVLTTSTNNTISGNSFSGTEFQAIYIIEYSDNNTISGNSIQGAGAEGIYLHRASNNTISGNTCAGNGLSGIKLLTASKNNTISGNTCQGNTEYGIWINATCDNNTISGNTCADNGTGATKYSGIRIDVTHEHVIAGNQCEGNGLHGIHIYRSDYCAVTGNVCNNQETGDGIYITGDATRNADYNEVVGNNCYNNGNNGIEIAGGVNANYNSIKANITMNNTGRGVFDRGTNTIFDQAMHSIALDLTGGATDIEVFFAKCPCILAGYSILYSVATGAGAGVNIRVGRYQDGVALDDDYFDVSVSELNKAKGYSKHFDTNTLTQRVIAAGDTITIGTAGGKVDTGEVIVVLQIAEMAD